MSRRKLNNRKVHVEKVRKVRKEGVSFVNFAKNFAPFAVKEYSYYIKSNIYPS
jgi:hypothetical protein